MLEQFSRQVVAVANADAMIYHVYGLWLTDLIQALLLYTPVDRLRDGRGRTD